MKTLFVAAGPGAGIGSAHFFTKEVDREAYLATQRASDFLQFTMKVQDELDPRETTAAVQAAVASRRDNEKTRKLGDAVRQGWANRAAAMGYKEDSHEMAAAQLEFILGAMAVAEHLNITMPVGILLAASVGRDIAEGVTCAA